MEDNVNHPKHYKSKSGLEAIDVIRAFTEDLSGMEAVDTANAIKYVLRWKHKNGVEDIKKAIWYLNDLLNVLEGYPSISLGEGEITNESVILPKYCVDKVIKMVEDATKCEDIDCADCMAEFVCSKKYTDEDIIKHLKGEI